MSEMVDRPMTSKPVRAYAMKARGDKEALEVIAGIICLYGIEMHALIYLYLLIHMYALSMCSIR